MADFDTITVSSGELLEVSVNDDEILSNIVYDITASGAGVHIDAFGTGWEISDIGVKGLQEKDVPIITAGASDGGAGLIEHVYLGDGIDPSFSDSGGLASPAANVHSDPQGAFHEGHITFRKVFAKQFGHGGIRVNDTTIQDTDRSGEVLIERCYSRSSNMAQFLLGQEGHVVKDSLAEMIVSETQGNIGLQATGVSALDWQEGSSAGNTAEAKNCDVWVEDTYAYLALRGSDLQCENCRWQGARETDGRKTYGEVSGDISAPADRTPPEGVPMSPEEAASGQQNGGGGGNGNGNGNGDGKGVPPEVVFGLVGGGAVAGAWWVMNQNN